MKMILDRAGLLYKILLASVLGLMVLIVFVNVVLRKFFHSGLSFTEEALRYLFIWMSYLGIVAAYKTNSHIRVTLVSEKLPVKWRAALGLMMNVIIMYALWFCANGAFAYIGINYGTYGELVKIPYYLVISSIVFACLGLAVLIFCEMARQLVTVFSRE